LTRLVFGVTPAHPCLDDFARAADASSLPRKEQPVGAAAKVTNDATGFEIAARDRTIRLREAVTPHRA
jgi:hypothetical protein